MSVPLALDDLSTDSIQQSMDMIRDVLPADSTAVVVHSNGKVQVISPERRFDYPKWDQAELAAFLMLFLLHDSNEDLCVRLENRFHQFLLKK